jgi:hypothetical protein
MSFLDHYRRTGFSELSSTAWDSMCDYQLLEKIVLSLMDCSERMELPATGSNVSSSFSISYIKYCNRHSLCRHGRDQSVSGGTNPSAGLPNTQVATITPHRLQTLNFLSDREASGHKVVVAGWLSHGGA